MGWIGLVVGSALVVAWLAYLWWALKRDERDMVAVADATERQYEENVRRYG